MNKLIVTSLFMLASHAFAQPAAIVLFTEQKVVMTHDGVESPLARGSALDVSDEVITTANALANIQYSNGTLVNIGANTHYKILAYAPKQSDVQIKAELAYGKIEIKTLKKTRETLSTPISSLAINGTQLKVYVSNPKTTYIQVSDGLVSVGARVIAPGTSVQVIPDGIVNTPFPAAGNVNASANASGTIKSNTNSKTKMAEHHAADSVTAADITQMLGTTTATSISTLAQLLSA